MNDLQISSNDVAVLANLSRKPAMREFASRRLQQIEVEEIVYEVKATREILRFDTKKKKLFRQSGEVFTHEATLIRRLRFPEKEDALRAEASELWKTLEEEN